MILCTSVPTFTPSPMKLLFINPVFALSISFGSRGLSLAAILEDAMLYRTLDNEMGLQFFNRSRCLLPFGRQLIIVCLRLRGRE